MKNMNQSVSRRVKGAVFAALYVALCLALAPFSYGAVQVRVAEALCLLPIFGREYITAITLGCFLANLLGSSTIDVIFGTLATFLACIGTYHLRHVRIKGLAIPASLPPVLCNAVIVGLEISFFFMDTPATLPAVLMNMLTVGIGEVISCTVLGVAMVKLIEANPALKERFMK